MPETENNEIVKQSYLPFTRHFPTDRTKTTTTNEIMKMKIILKYFQRF